MRTLLLTSTYLRHQFVASEVSKRTELVGVWQEDHPFNPLKGLDTHSEDARIISRHFQARDLSEEKYFGEHLKGRVVLQDVVLRRLPSGGINDPKEMDRMSDLKPDLVLVFGSGLLKPPLIDRLEGRIINMHLGLSPYYRGSGTNFWPLVNREPEYVGVTIHYIDPGIDTGPIIAHGRPEIEVADGPHDLGNKTIIVGCDLLIRAAERHHQLGCLQAIPQWERGKIYQIKDFSADAVRQLDRNFKEGMIEDYLSEKFHRDRAIRLVPLPQPINKI